MCHSVLLPLLPEGHRMNCGTIDIFRINNYGLDADEIQVLAGIKEPEILDTPKVISSIIRE